MLIALPVATNNVVSLRLQPLCKVRRNETPSSCYAYLEFLVGPVRLELILAQF